MNKNKWKKIIKSCYLLLSSGVYPACGMTDILSWAAIRMLPENCTAITDTKFNTGTILLCKLTFVFPFYEVTQGRP